MTTDATFATLVTFVLGVITSVIASVTLITTKENRISEFRQAWIDAQRADLAVAVATANSYFHIRDAEKRAICINEFFAARTRIALRDKPQGAEWTKALLALDKLGKVMISGVPNAFDTMQATAIVTTESRIPLKLHWETVKAGEPFYRRFKRTFVWALVPLVLGTASALLLWQPSQGADEKRSPISFSFSVH